MSSSSYLLAAIKFPIDANNLSIRADQTRERLRFFPTMVGGQSIIEPLLVGYCGIRLHIRFC